MWKPILASSTPPTFRADSPRVNHGSPSPRRSNAMAGASGFMRFLAADHGAILRLHGHSVDAIRFLIGHPLMAVCMTTHAIGSALNAPLSLLVASDGHGTRLEYDRPSSLFSQ